MRIIFANVTHGFVYAQLNGASEGMIFSKFSIPDYVEYFKQKNPDILCLAEVLIDTPDKKSEFIDSIVENCNLPYSKVLINEKSWIYVGRYYGMAVLSKFPITHYEDFLLPNPKFEVDRPNGDHWILHDKYAQFAKIKIENKSINIFNLHYFPVHHFNKTLDAPELKNSKMELVKYFTKEGTRIPTIVCGDFNNKHGKLLNVFPELFENNYLGESVEVETTILDGIAQLDHILFTPSFIKIKNSNVEKFLSDHYSLTVDLEIL